MAKSFTNNFFTNNRKRLKSEVGDNPIIISANGSVQRAGDSAYPFRQDSNFWYLTGIDEPDMVLVMLPEQEFIILPERSSIQETFDGKIDKALLQQTSGIETFYSFMEGWEALRLATKQSKFVNTCLYNGFDTRHSMYLNPAKPRLVSRLKKMLPKARLNDTRKTLAKMRMIKQPPEINAIKQAVKVTKESFAAVFVDDWAKQYKNEAEISARLSYEFAKRGCQPAYPSIVAGGQRAVTLHYDKNNQPIDTSELLLVDAGAEYNNYAADITRVFNAEPMEKFQRQVYSAVKKAQKLAYKQLKPGALLGDVESIVEKNIGEFLLKRGIITKPEREQIRKFYPHSFSHHLGLDVHDVADYSRPLSEGMVITVEPGIYIADKHIGVRLEDDVLITKTGHQVLSRSLPS